jgi:phage portal protein BeeE
MKQYGFSPEQMDMKALHRVPEERIAAVLRVPAIIAGLGAGLDRSTYANFREAREMFAEMTILPLYGFDQATVNTQLLPDFTNDPRVSTAFDITDLRALQEDEDKKYARLNIGVQGRWVTKNEARADVGLSPIEGGDTIEAPAAPMLPQGQKARTIELKADEITADTLQALVELAAPGLAEELTDYFDGQRRRVKRALVSGQ